ncbi:MAG: hypothetical protein ABSH41_31050, partial [Syntrophobacteraceae bacterium]
MTIYGQLTACFNGRREGIFTTAEIKRIIKAKYGTNEASVIPSDYSYNSWNKGRAPMDHSLFEKIGVGKYQYLGLNYRYTGPIVWRGGHVVGYWNQGQCSMFNQKGYSETSWPGLDSKGIGVDVNQTTGTSKVVFLSPLPGSQAEFEDYLKDLLKDLETLRRTHPITDIYFPGGGNLIIPEWFL